MEKLYRYGMRLRGYSIGCQPSGVKYFQDADKKETGYWNYIYYDRLLTDEELMKYDLDNTGTGYLSIDKKED